MTSQAGQSKNIGFWEYSHLGKWLEGDGHVRMNTIVVKYL